MNSNRNLGELYNDEFFHLEEALEPHEISLMENTLDKTQFYRFNPFKFNVYYCLMIVSGFLITLSLAGHYVYKMNQLQDLLETKGISTKTSFEEINLKSNDSKKEDVKNNTTDNNFKNNNNNLNNKTLKQHRISNNNPELTINTAIKNEQINKVTEPTLNIANENSELKKNEVVPLPQESNIIDPKIAKPKPKRIVFVTQQDTLYQRDTIKTAPRKPKK